MSTPTVAAENSVRVWPWHLIRLASESRSKPHPHHSLSEHPQPISAAVMEHSAIEQTQGAIRAPLKVDHSQSDKSQDAIARAWVVNLEKEFQDLPIADPGRIKDDLDC